jgi:hypothetical protein
MDFRHVGRWYYPPGCDDTRAPFYTALKLIAGATVALAVGGFIYADGAELGLNEKFLGLGLTTGVFAALGLGGTAIGEYLWHRSISKTLNDTGLCHESSDESWKHV